MNDFLQQVLRERNPNVKNGTQTVDNPPIKLSQIKKPVIQRQSYAEWKKTQGNIHIVIVIYIYVERNIYSFEYYPSILLLLYNLNILLLNKRVLVEFLVSEYDINSSKFVGFDFL